jgi:hypothetical protein
MNIPPSIFVFAVNIQTICRDCSEGVGSVPMVLGIAHSLGLN